jgi:hypothetical protein
MESGEFIIFVDQKRVMIYYRVTFYTNREDGIEGLPRRGGMKGINWLKYNGDDGGLEIGQEREDESLAIKILIQNLQLVEIQLLGTTDPSELKNIGKTTRYVKNEDDLKEVIAGEYPMSLVAKYESNHIVD